MYKIENSLLIKDTSNNLLIISALDTFFKESHMLFSNLHLNYVLSRNGNDFFPLNDNLYDASWYKNIFIASSIIIDRFNSIINPNKNYVSIFEKESLSNFEAFLKNWKEINFVVKNNMEFDVYTRRNNGWEISETTLKIEQLLNARINIDTQLLKTTSLNLNNYQPLKVIVNEEPLDSFEDLLSYVSDIPEENSETSPLLPSIGTPKTKNEELIVQVDSLINWISDKEVNINKLNEGRAARPVNSLKKEMDQVLSWIASREKDLKEYKINAKFGYSTEEYNGLDDELKLILSEISSNDSLIKEAKTLFPVSDHKKEMDNILKWIDSRSKDLKEYRAMTYDPHFNNKLELTGIEKELVNLEFEIKETNADIKEVRGLFPVSDHKKEMDNILKWIDSRSIDLKEYKMRTKGLSDAEELRLIAIALKNAQKDLESSDILLKDVKKEQNKQKDLLRATKPISPLKKEMDSILKWIESKDADIKKYKLEIKGLSDAEELRLIAIALKNAQKDLESSDLLLKDVRKKEALLRATKPISPLKKEMDSILKWIESREVQVKNYKREMAILNIGKVPSKVKPITNNKKTKADLNEIRKEQDFLIDWASKKEKVISDEKNKILSKELNLNEKSKEELRQLLSDIRKAKIELSKIDKELMNTKKEISKTNKLTFEAKDILKPKTSSLVVTPKNKTSTFKTSLYKEETNILKIAFEALPSDVKKNASKKLPDMIKNLIEEGYIENKDKKNKKKN